MKLYKSFLALLFVFSVFIVQNAYAESISGRYQFNANNNIGYIDIDLDGNNLTGKMVWFIDRNGQAIEKSANIVEGEVEYSDGTVHITFSRSGSNQIYHGWFSYDRKLISGYFENGYRVPWFALKIN